MQPPVRKAASAACAAVVTVGALLLPGLPATADVEATTASSGTDKLGAHDRAVIAQAQREYQRQARTRSLETLPDTDIVMPAAHTVVIATDPGRTAEAAAQIEALGAFVTRTDDALGYVKASVPFTAVEDVLALDAVLAVDAEEILALEDVSVSPESIAAAAAAAAPVPAPAPGATTPDANPYLPTQDTGSARFKAEHPAYDGRGTTIGILDSGVDPTHPALETTSTGEPKLVGSSVAVDPTDFLSLILDGTWQLTTNNVPTGRETHSYSFTYQGQRHTEVYTLPDDSGSGFTFGRKQQTLPDGSETPLATLIDPVTETVWVDTDHDLDFTDAPGMQEFDVSGDVGHRTEDDPATAVSEAIPYTVQVDTVRLAGVINYTLANLNYPTSSPPAARSRRTRRTSRRPRSATRCPPGTRC